MSPSAPLDAEHKAATLHAERSLSQLSTFTAGQSAAAATLPRTGSSCHQFDQQLLGIATWASTDQCSRQYAAMREKQHAAACRAVRDTCCKQGCSAQRACSMIVRQCGTAHCSTTALFGRQDLQEPTELGGPLTSGAQSLHTAGHQVGLSWAMNLRADPEQICKLRPPVS